MERAGKRSVQVKTYCRDLLYGPKIADVPFAEDVYDGVASKLRKRCHHALGDQAVRNETLLHAL
eukprot:1534125-Pleurochrysis_carterae.AAC.1